MDFVIISKNKKFVIRNMLVLFKIIYLLIYLNYLINLKKFVTKIFIKIIIVP